MQKYSSLFTAFLLLTILTLSQSLHLRSVVQKHQQMGIFADVMNNSNHIDGSLSIGPTGSTEQSSGTGPKVAVGIIIPIICVVLCCICCFFCLRCAKNQQQQAQEGLHDIPCYCGPIKCLGNFCKYLLCFDIILRCLGLRSTNWEKKQQLRLQQEQEQRKKEQKQRLKYQKKHGNSNQPNPYQTELRREQLSPAHLWVTAGDKTDCEKVKHQKCQLCQGKVKKHSNIMTACSGHCVFHLQCLITYKNSNSFNKASNECPSCKSNYFNNVRFYCQKCWSKYSEMQIESGNVYASQLDFGEAIKSIGGEKCDQCSKKKWFWQ